MFENKTTIVLVNGDTLSNGYDAVAQYLGDSPVLAHRGRTVISDRGWVVARPELAERVRRHGVTTVGDMFGAPCSAP